MGLLLDTLSFIKQMAVLLFILGTVQEMNWESRISVIAAYSLSLCPDSLGHKIFAEIPDSYSLTSDTYPVCPLVTGFSFHGIQWESPCVVWINCNSFFIDGRNIPLCETVHNY